jgi:GH15 family glucan-1,4-alpha-glucosidase
MAEVEKDERLEKCKEPDVHPKENVKLPCYTEEQKELECELEKKRGLKASHCLEWSGLTHEEQPYLEISEHGLIGNLCSCALVGSNGNIDYLCLPHFDSPTIFGCILDSQKGGFFGIQPQEEKGSFNYHQAYWPDTNILVTRTLGDRGVAQIIDYMPIKEEAPTPEIWCPGLTRIVEGVRGAIKYHMKCYPAFNYAKSKHKVVAYNGGAIFCCTDKHTGFKMHCVINTNVKLDIKEHGVEAIFEVKGGDRIGFDFFMLNEAQAEELLDKSNGTLKHLEKIGALGQKIDGNFKKKMNIKKLMQPKEGDEFYECFKKNVNYWRHWLSQCTYKGRWQEMVHRSALALKLLTFKETGAIVAAATTSLPEQLGGPRNWDYRYTWIRDASFTVYALLRIGFKQEAAEFMSWLEARCHELNEDGSLQIMYGIRGEHKLDEEILDHLEGYKGSFPVRIGNNAYNQLQLDIYGELMDGIYLFNKWGAPLSYDMWSYVRRLVGYVCKNWRTPDEGICEARAARQHYTYSKIMCWVAVDRAIRLSERRSFPADRELWIKTRDEIYEEIMDRGYCEERKVFTQYYDSTTLDASSLIMPLVFFTSPTDPRFLSTVDLISKSPDEGGLTNGGLVYRYDFEKFKDGLDSDEGTFNICTFWLIEALARSGELHKDRIANARLLFEQMLTFANHVGLFAEETDKKGLQFGNFPQAFTHLGLISAAYNLDRSISGSHSNTSSF